MVVYLKTICSLPHACSRTHTPTPTRTHTHTDTYTHAHTHTHTHMHVYRMNSEVVELPFSDAIVANRETPFSKMEPVRSESK